MEKRMVELFAGVGGFRLGMERLDSGWKTVWFSQWEPGRKRQDAHDCYVKHFGDCLDLNGEYTTGMDINLVDKKIIPDCDLVMIGLPCQDYSIAHNLLTAKGIEGKKGVLWWQFRDFLIAKRPSFCFLENVDRLLKSPAKQRGRDFGIMLACLADLGYSAEWRVVNAAQYGAAQRRRRVFVFIYRNDTKYALSMVNQNIDDLFLKTGFMANAFPIVSMDEIKETMLPDDIVDVSDNFAFSFEKAGYMVDGKVFTRNVVEEEIPAILLKDILEQNVDEKYYISDEKIEKWRYMRSYKRFERTAANGHKYMYSEGAMAFPDDLNKPGRTMLTSESTVNRSSHVIEDPETHRLRILTPVEAERLQGFDDNWTNTGMSERMRYFCMGNALVVPMVSRMGAVLDDIIVEE